MLAGFLFTVDEAAVDSDFEDAAGAGDQLDFSNALWSERPQFGRQTGGAGFVVSHLAVFDRDMLDHGGMMAMAGGGASSGRLMGLMGLMGYGVRTASMRRKSGEAGSHNLISPLTAADTNRSPSGL